MQRKKTQYTYGGMNKDTTKTKHDPTVYYDASHIRLLATDSQSSGSISNEKGTLSLFSIPTLELKGANDIQIEAVDFSITVEENSTTVIDLLPKIVYQNFSITSFEGTSFSSTELTFTAGSATNSFVPYTYTVVADNGTVSTGVVSIKTTALAVVDPGQPGTLVTITESGFCQTEPWILGTAEVQPGIIKKYFTIEGLLPSTQYEIDLVTDFSQSQNNVYASLFSSTDNISNHAGRLKAEVLIDCTRCNNYTDLRSRVTYTLFIKQNNITVGSLTLTDSAADIYDNGNINNVASCTTRINLVDNAE